MFAGCGAIVADATHDGALGTVGVGLVFGLVIMAMVYATGHLSGAHINPAVTLAFTLTRHFPGREAAAYVGRPGGRRHGRRAALLGAVWKGPRRTSERPSRSVGAGSAVLYEIVLTAILMFVIMAVATDTRAVGAASGDRDRRGRRARCPVRRADHRRVDEPGPLARARAGERRVDATSGSTSPARSPGAALGALAYQGIRGPLRRQDAG